MEGYIVNSLYCKCKLIIFNTKCNVFFVLEINIDLLYLSFLDVCNYGEFGLNFKITRTCTNKCAISRH